MATRRLHLLAKPMSIDDLVDRLRAVELPASEARGA